MIANAVTITGNITTTVEYDATINLPDTIDVPPYEGEYSVTPQAGMATVLDTDHKYLSQDIVVNPIPYQEVSNESGTTVYIASEVV